MFLVIFQASDSTILPKYKHFLMKTNLVVDRTPMFKGFSLLEILVTVSVISIIAGISVAQYQEYKRHANDLVALTSLYNARTGIEAMYADKTNQIQFFTFRYNDDLTSLSYPNQDSGIPGYTHTEGVNLDSCSTVVGDYFITAAHIEGTAKTTPQVGNRRATVAPKTYGYESTKPAIISDYPGYFGLYNYVCSGPVVPP